MRQIWVGCILLSTAVGGQAATLGRHSGAAVIGRPLDVRVQALLAPGEDLNDLCVSTDVFYGDNQVSPGAVRITPQKSAPDAEASLRIQASVPVDEPVVTVYVRSGCSAPFSRRYVLLADPLTEPQSAPPAAAAGSTAPTARALPLAPSVAGADDGASAAVRAPATPSAVHSGSTGAASALPPVAGVKPSKPAPVKARASDGKPAKPVSVVKRPVAPAAPRLELEPVDLNLALDRDPVLKMSLSMLSEPTASDQERAAAASLWKAINASPEDILRDNQKLQVLEAEAKGLREQEASNKAALESLQAQLEQSNHLRWLVVALGGALLAALLGLLYVWRRRRPAAEGADDPAARAWWAAATAEKALDGDAVIVPGKLGARAMDLDLDLDLSHDRASSLDSLRPLSDSALDADSSPAPLSPNDRREFAASQMGVSRSVATEELFDVQQQADFFISLGENEQAIQVLKNHLAESQEPSALAYLDLFKLYHQLGRRDEYKHLREDFNRTFNAGAPQFDQYTDEGRGLEAYENAFGRIQALWPQPRVLDVIEKSIFRDPGDAETEVFDLEAYRELLLLHAIAKDVIKRENAAPVQDFEHTAIKPLKAKKTPAAAGASAEMGGRETEPLDVMPHASPRLGLDVDLDELSEISAFEASLPEVPAPVQPSAKPAPPPGARPDIDMGNLIDFEMLDFMAPDDADGDKPGKKCCTALREVTKKRRRVRRFLWGGTPCSAADLQRARIDDVGGGALDEVHHVVEG